ncbi:unnamed protein product [Candida verbasci]|uniref:BHLH domain-containing protein n=1 Tax=Candida verbasci TaxID=1227364 RepID=A0A9W4TZ26_9ASCO|nr:unnamed protein product [Candida verbasci]
MVKRRYEDSADGVSKRLKDNELNTIDSELIGEQRSTPARDENREVEDEEDVETRARSDAAQAAAEAANKHQQAQQQLYHQQFGKEELVEGASGATPLSEASPTQDLQQSPGSDSKDKPAHGSEEWYRLRKENHKEVERRRRESINIGIKQLAQLIPTTDTNKAQILQRAVEYIKRLKENENNNIEKWTLEKLLTEQAVSELSASNEKLKQELERAYREIEHLKGKK